MSNDLTAIQEILRRHRQDLARDYGIRNIGVFGSCSRGEAGAGSDIDILVDFDRPIGFFRFLELEERLSQLLGAKVDLVSRDALKPHIGRRILKEAVML
jgi:predicted nucleotidyltransferase